MRSLELRNFQLCRLPGSTASKGHSDGAFEDFSDRNAVRYRIFNLGDKLANLIDEVWFLLAMLEERLCT